MPAHVHLGLHLLVDRVVHHARRLLEVAVLVERLMALPISVHGRIAHLGTVPDLMLTRCKVVVLLGK